MFAEVQDEIVSEVLNGLLDIEAEPCYVISGSGVDWFLDPFSREMVRLSRGVEVVPVSDEIDSDERILVRSQNRFLLVPAVELEEIGWN
jgi:hypothetical protein